MKRMAIILMLILLTGSVFAAATTGISSDILVRQYGTNKTDTVINAVITAVGTRVCRLIIDGGSWTISNNVIFPANVTVYVAAGSKLNIANGKTVTFNGGFEAGRYDVFDGTGVTAGSPKMTYRFSEWGDSLAYPMGLGAVNDMTASNVTVSGVWLITNALSSFGGVLGANVPDLTAAETVSGAWVHSANLTLDDGVGNSPSLILQDADDTTLTIIKLDTGNTTITSSEGDFVLTPFGDDVLIDGGLTVGSSTEAGDNNLRVEGDGTFIGNILGDDATIISNIATIACDLLVSDAGSLTVGNTADTTAIVSSDWGITATGIASGLGTIGCDGNITLTAASGAGVITARAASGENGVVCIDADAGANNADTWWLVSRASDNSFYLVNHITTNLTITSAGNGTVAGDWDIDGNDLTSPGDLTITPGGNEVLIDAGMNIGGTTQPGDNNLRVEGTLTQIGAAALSSTLAVALDSTFSGQIIGDKATDIYFIDNATFQDLTVTNSPIVISRYVLLAPNATTQDAYERGTCTNGQVISFTTAYAAAPAVMLTPTEVSTSHVYAASISVNGFTANGDDGTTLSWLAVGQK